MFLTAFLKRHSAPRAIFAALSLLSWGGAELFSQATVWPAAQAQAGNPAAVNDPTRPEIQPPLDIDRDPIPSPDRDVNPTATAMPAADANAPAGPNTASRTTTS